MGWWTKLLGRVPGQDGAAAYAAVVAQARDTTWYEQCGVPDTLDGRFAMVSTVLALVLLRLEGDPAAAVGSVRITERFVADMDGQLRQIGIGDAVVGKQMGRVMGLLGGRIGSLRDGLMAGDLGPALERNLYVGDRPEPEASAWANRRLLAFAQRLRTLPVDAVLAGTFA